VVDHAFAPFAEENRKKLKRFVIPDGAADPEPMPQALKASCPVRNNQTKRPPHRLRAAFCNKTGTPPSTAWVPDLRFACPE
jgi:hypothetical protein